MKEFAGALSCLVGRSGYELLQVNLGGALPSTNTVQRKISNRNVTEGHFYFDELKSHLNEWEAPLFVHVHLDETRIKHGVEYDQTTDRFVGWCLPTKEGIPECNAFVFQTFEDIKHAFHSETVAK